MTTLAYPMRVARNSKPFRLASRITADCRSIIDQAIANYGLNEASIVELAVREFGEKRGITPKRGIEFAVTPESKDPDPTTYPEGGTKGQIIHEK